MTSTNDFPTAGVELRHLLVVSDYARFFEQTVNFLVGKVVNFRLFALERFQGLEYQR
jgi:hypothetical protein